MCHRGNIRIEIIDSLYFCISKNYKALFLQKLKKIKIKYCSAIREGIRDIMMMMMMMRTTILSINLFQGIYELNII